MIERTKQQHQTNKHCVGCDDTHNTEVRWEGRLKTLEQKQQQRRRRRIIAAEIGKISLFSYTANIYTALWGVQVNKKLKKRKKTVERRRKKSLYIKRPKTLKQIRKNEKNERDGTT